MVLLDDSFRCENHTAELFDRGGMTPLGPLSDLSLVRWERMRDDISFATVWVQTPSERCLETLAKMEPGRTEVVIYRGGERVWEGPITRVAYRADRIEIEARDIVHYLHRTIMRSAHDNSYPNTTTVIQRMTSILEHELERMEDQSPPINVLPHVRVLAGEHDARTARSSMPWEFTVYEHMDNLAANAGLDYCTVGRSLVLWDTRTPVGQTHPISRDDFIGEPVVTVYGMEGGTFAAVTDGQGRAGWSGGADSYYGLIEILDNAYDEDAEEGDPPSIAEMQSQAQRNLAGRNPTPINLRIPDNTRLNPMGSLTLNDMVPGVFIPLRADLPGRRLSQMQKLDSVRVEEGASSGEGGGETFSVTLSPAPGVISVEED